MKFKSFDVYSWVVGVVFVVLSFLLLFGFGFPILGSVIDWLPRAGSIFCFDGVSRYLLLLSGVLWISLSFFVSSLSVFSWGMISLSVVSSVLSYCCVHVVWFWVFYEVSILPLLLLLVMDSPYSERYTAAWYLLGYVILTSLPMLLCLFYFSCLLGSFCFDVWYLGESFGYFSFLVLSVLFITKIPLPPFHVWLPIVHAEATSAVSVCLSGYIMKLGVLGVCRFCSWLLPDYVFCSSYVLFVLVLGVLFFFSACRELDGKRWLAFLSLSHILVACCCLSVVGFEGSGLAFLFCLGHGLSAGVTFLLLWVVYDVSGSRNWGVLKFSLSGSLLMRILCTFCVCTVASLPCTVQFFCEVYVIINSGFVSGLFVLAFFCYMFFGGLVPLFLLGVLLSRHYSVSVGAGNIFGSLASVVLLVVWSFSLFLVA